MSVTYVDIAVSLIPLVGGVLSGLFRSSDSRSWYNSLSKAPWNPPSWVFGPVWSLLYLSMGLSYHLISKRVNSTNRQPVLGLFWAQLGLNLLWSPVFFGLNAPKTALMIIAILWGFIGWVIEVFKSIYKPAAQLLVPYWAWVTYAFTLNAYIVLFN